MRPAQSLPAVLVVDDTPSIQQLLMHTLRELVPYEIVTVANASAALAVLAARPVPLLITDYHLSDMRGDALAAAVKAASPATKVMMISADIALDGNAQWPNVDCYLIKPFPLRQLAAAVGALLPGSERAR
jgi:DNA-binding NtrC family response regulator